MKAEDISSTAARNGMPTPIRKRAEDNDGFTAQRADAVAFMLGRISDPTVSLFGRVKVAGDTADSGPIERALLIKVCYEHGKEWIPRWTGPGRKPKTHKADTIRNLVRIALFEELYGCVCPECCGRRWIEGPETERAWFWKLTCRIYWDKPIQKICDRCGGRGISTWTDVDRAAMLEMKYTTFKNTWSGRIRTIRSYMSEFSEIIEAIEWMRR